MEGVKDELLCVLGLYFFGFFWVGMLIDNGWVYGFVSVGRYLVVFKFEDCLY